MTPNTLNRGRWTVHRVTTIPNDATGEEVADVVGDGKRGGLSTDGCLSVIFGIKIEGSENDAEIEIWGYDPETEAPYLLGRTGPLDSGESAVVEVFSHRVWGVVKSASPSVITIVASPGAPGY
jgi:hypothetical protein